MDDFGVSLNKAKRLIASAKVCTDLFMYDSEKNTLIARTFKTYRNISYSRKNRKIYQMYCIKLNTSDSRKLGEIKRGLKKAIIACVVNAKQHIDKFTFRGSLPCHRSSDAFTLQHFANIAGVTRKTATKYVNQLREQKVLDVRKGELCETTKEMNKEKLLRLRREGKYVVPSKGMFCIFRMTQYSISDRSFSERFCNIIYNHLKRITFNASENKEEEDIMEKECMSMFW